MLTVQEDGRTGSSDEVVLDRALELDRVLFSQDDDLLVEANRRQKTNLSFSGVIYGHQLHLTIGEAIDDLELVAKTTTAEELTNQVLFLPLGLSCRHFALSIACPNTNKPTLTLTWQIPPRKFFEPHIFGVGASPLAAIAELRQLS